MGWAELQEPAVDLLFSLRIGKATTRRGVRNYHLLFLGGARLTRVLDPEELFEQFEASLHKYVPALAEGCVLLQSMALEIDGQALLLPGCESEAVWEALLKAGMSPIAREIVVLHGDGAVGAYPTFKSSSPVACIAFVEDSERVKGFRPRRLSEPKTSFYLLGRALNAHNSSDRVLEIIASVTALSTNLKGRYRNADEAAQVLLKRMS